MACWITSRTLAIPSNSSIPSNPHHFVKKFKNATFYTNFDSSNLEDIVELKDNYYEGTIYSDPSSININNNYRTWYYFSISSNISTDITIKLKNLNRHLKLYNNGLRTVYSNDLIIWQRISKLNYKESDDKKYLILTFTHNCKINEMIYFAFSYPFSYNDSINMIDRIDKTFLSRPYLYNYVSYNTEILCYSIQSRPIHLLTITSPSNNIKKIICITSRIHPGEIGASHMFNGFLYFILSNDKRAIILRDIFIFKLIPILNPDGVANGNYRTDSQGLNLNRYYDNPDINIHPIMYALKNKIMEWNSEKKLFMYLDFHAHANKKGLFLYGNALHGKSQVQNLLFPKILEINSPHLEFNSCNFDEKRMNEDDLMGESRGGSSRVALYQATKLIHCYTLECNYFSSTRIHSLPKLTENSMLTMKDAINLISNGSGEDGLPISNALQLQVDGSSDSGMSAREYNLSRFQSMGESVAISILDLVNLNPISRINGSPYKTFSGIRNFVEDYVKENEEDFKDEELIQEIPIFKTQIVFPATETKQITSARSSIPRKYEIQPNAMNIAKKITPLVSKNVTPPLSKTTTPRTPPLRVPLSLTNSVSFSSLEQDIRLLKLKNNHL